MSSFVGVDVSKEKFDACCIDEQGEKLFSLTCSMNREGFEKFIGRLPKDKSSFLVGMESTASYHIPLFAYIPFPSLFRYLQIVLSNLPD